MGKDGRCHSVKYLKRNIPDYSKELLCLMQPVHHQISGIHRISHYSMKPEKSWRPSSFVSAKVMDFQDHVCIANKPERTILHLQRQRNAALRKSEQPSVNSGLGFGRKIVEIKAKNV